MGFDRDDVAALLVQCHRRCCVCHRFCGVKMETDHIVPAAEGGPDTIDNAIPLCFECHAEVHSYNDKHPRGRKFTPHELRGHKDQWLATCRDHPDALVNASHNVDVGPLQALIDELDFNEVVAAAPTVGRSGCLFADAQFRRAIEHGAIAILLDEVRPPLLAAYRAMGAANAVLAAMWHQNIGNAMATLQNEARDRIKEAAPLITEAKAQLLRFLSSAA